VAWVSGPQLPVAAGGRTRDVVAALGTRLGVGGAEFRRAAGEKVVDSGFTGVLRADLLPHLGGWDEEWHINEDGEIAARVRAAGGRIVCVPEMAADYVPRGTLRGLAVQYHRYGMYRCKTARRHPSALRRTHLVPPVLLTMHVSWALGFARGIARFGVPWRGLLRCAGIVPGSPGDDRSGRGASGRPRGGPRCPGPRRPGATGTCG